MSTGIRIIFDNFPALQAAMKPAIDRAIDKNLFDAQAFIEQGMGSSGSPSAPGAMPAVVTGELVSSLVVTGAQDLHGSLEADGGHAIFLEFGTVKMAARPFLQPAATHIVVPLAADIRAVLERGTP